MTIDVASAHRVVEIALLFPIALSLAAVEPWYRNHYRWVVDVLLMIGLVATVALLVLVLLG